ncbi:SCP2 sterol-binding domain-containing protein [Dactylosporangium sp. NPDC000555]|uniref:SCP2 sterol-binding domain-containing protein n=1 Tax=Dactylosporangium sp. NPDC000555 TaxID=3154260 RepID=UPI00332AE373
MTAEPTETDPTTLDELEFARLVKRLSADELRRLVAGPARTGVLDMIFERMPGVFRSARAGAMRAVIHWRIGGRPDGGEDVYELVVADAVVRVSPRPQHEPDLALSTGIVEFLQIVTGNAHPVAMVMRGKLRTSGDRLLTMKFPTLFAVPKP